MFDPVSDEEKKRFIRQSYGAHLPGYTGHCPTLKFRVGKRFGANTEEIMRELLEKKILKSGPYRPNSGKDVALVTISKEKDIRRDWKNDAHLYKPPPYILGYTGYIPGFNNRYGLPFMRAVEEGAKEWHEVQSKLRARRDVMKAQAERTDSRNLLSRVRADNVAVEIDHGQERERVIFDCTLSPEKPPIVGYTGHIPGAKGEVALSKGYTQAAKKGLELVRKEREQRLNKKKNVHPVQRVLDVACVDETGHTRA
ncbi:protein FAM166B-like isoform X1 [Vespa velutina]|uniref:protein FAM166B-like isoform X1 n=2 Tax=Vespa velutina TaxID=202808 RepID=UPI001FB4A764|nr:protein FAM166B-like isoform X1 [Vespa velutina]